MIFSLTRLSLLAFLASSVVAAPIQPVQRDGLIPDLLSGVSGALDPGATTTDSTADPTGDSGDDGSGDADTTATTTADPDVAATTTSPPPAETTTSPPPDTEDTTTAAPPADEDTTTAAPPVEDTTTDAVAPTTTSAAPPTDTAATSPPPADIDVSTSTTSAADSTGTVAADTTAPPPSSSGGGISTKTIVILSAAGGGALFVLAAIFLVMRQIKAKKSDEFDDRLAPIDFGGTTAAVPAAHTRRGSGSSLESGRSGSQRGLDEKSDWGNGGGMAQDWTVGAMPVTAQAYGAQARPYANAMGPGGGRPLLGRSDSGASYSRGAGTPQPGGYSRSGTPVQGYSDPNARGRLVNPYSAYAAAQPSQVGRGAGDPYYRGGF